MMWQGRSAGSWIGRCMRPTRRMRSTTSVTDACASVRPPRALTVLDQAERSVALCWRSPGVPQQRARARPPLRVLPEALQQEALHVLAQVVRQRWVLILHTPHLLLGLSKFCKCMPGGGTTATYIAATGLEMCDLQLSARSWSRGLR